MKTFQLWVLFILLSLFSFGAKPGQDTCGGEPNGNGIGIWAESIDFNSDGTLSLIIKARTGAKFGIPQELKVYDIEITSGFGSENPSAVMATHLLPVISTNPKIVTKWEAKIPINLNLTNGDIRLKGNVDIFEENGNQHAIDSKGLCFGPFVAPNPNGNIELKVYEKLATADNWENISTERVGEEIKIDPYIFTKGGERSKEPTPAIYTVGYAGEGGGTLERIKVKVNGVDKAAITDFNEKDSFVKPISDLKESEENTVVAIPVSVFGVEGTPVTLDFVVDTEINSSKLGDGIIGELDSEGKIKINLSEIKELSGIKGYSYILKVGDKTNTGAEVLNGNSFTSPTIDSVDTIVEIPIDTINTFIGGSKGTLLFTVYDKLGHEKTFEKTYFIPKQLEGINSKISGEAKQRESKIKVVTEGSNDKFEVENSIDTSNE